MNATPEQPRRISAAWSRLWSLRRTKKFGTVCVVLALLGLLLTFLCVAIFAAADIDPRSPLAIALALVLLLLVPAVTFAPLVMIVGFYKVDHKYLQNIVLSYVSVLLAYTNIYWLLMIVLGNPPLPFEGIHPIWSFTGTGAREILLKDAMLCCVDCFHFSLATISTLGYGDMVPTAWYSKLICNLEVITGGAIVVVGFGRFFSRKRAAE